MSKTLTWKVRPTPPSIAFPDGVPAEEFTVEFDDHEWEHLKDLRQKLDQYPDSCPERTELLNEFNVLFELKALLDARMLSADEIEARAESTDDIEIDADDLAARVERLRAEQPFRIPETALVQLALTEAATEQIARQPVRSGKMAAAERDNMVLSDPDENTFGRQHATPTDTERGAAIAVFPRTGTQRHRVLDAIALAGPRGLTNEELGKVAGISDTAHRTRRKELEEGGWVIDSGRRRESDSGTPSIVYVLSERGLREWEPSAEAQGATA